MRPDVSSPAPVAPTDVHAVSTWPAPPPEGMAVIIDVPSSPALPTTRPCSVCNGTGRVASSYLDGDGWPGGTVGCLDCDGSGVGVCVDDEV